MGKITGQTGFSWLAASLGEWIQNWGGQLHHFSVVSPSKIMADPIQAFTIIKSSMWVV